MDFMHIWGQKEAMWNTFFSINWFVHGVLENQIQALSRTFRHRFKDFQGPCLFWRTFQALKNWKKIKDFQGILRTRKSPVLIYSAFCCQCVLINSVLSVQCICMHWLHSTHNYSFLLSHVNGIIPGVLNTVWPHVAVVRHYVWLTPAQ